MADGSLIFDTKVDDSDFKTKIKSMDSSAEKLKGVMKSLSGTMEKVFNNKSNSTAQGIDNESSKMMSLNEQLKKAEIGLENAKQKLHEFVSQQIPTEEYAAVEREANKLEQKLLSLLDKKERFEETGGNTNSRTYQQMQYDIDTVEKKLELAEGKMCRLNEEGKKFKTGDEGQFEKLSNGVDSAQSKVDILKQKMSELSAKENETGKSGTSMFQKMSGATQTLSSKLFNATKNSAKMGGTLAKNINPAPKMISGVSKKVEALGKKLAGMVKRVFVFSMMTKALRALRTAMQNVVSSDKDMAGSLAQIKGNLLTAFAPLYSFVLPAIKTVLSAFVTFTNYLANVMSSIFGKTISQSKALAQEINKNSQATDKNTKSTKKNNKEKERQLSGLDQMNRWNSDKDSDKDEGSSTAPVFNATEMNVDWVDKIKNMMASGNWEGIGKFVANKLNDSLKKIPWGKIQSTAKSIATKLARTLNGFFSVMDLAKTLGNTVAQALNTGLMFAYKFLTTFNFSQFGTFIGTSINSFIKNFKWGLLGDTLGSAVQGVIDTAYGFVTTYKWGSFASGLSKTINRFFKKIKWGKAGRTVGQAIIGIFDEISTFLSKVKWEKIGKSIGTFLSSIDWYGIVKKLFNIIVKAVKACFKLIISTLKGLVKKGIDPVEGAFLALGVTIASIKLTGVILKLYDMYKKFILLSNGEKIATVTTKLFGTAINMSLGKVLLIVTAVGALIGIFAKLVTSQSQTKTSTDQLRERMDALDKKAKEVSEAMKEAHQHTEEAFKEINVEYDELDTYKSKLESITEESGKIKEGHKAEAQAIIDILNPALGLSLEIVGGQLKGYQEINKTIDETIRKQELQAKKDAMQQEYNTAINNRAQAYDNVKGAIDEVNNAQADYYEKLAAYNNLRLNPIEGAGYKQDLNDAQKAVEKASSALEEAKNKQKEYQGTLDGINKTINEYTSMSDALLSGNADKIKETLTRVNNGIVKTSDTTLATLQENEKKVQEKYDKLKAMKADGIAVSDSELKETRAALKLAKDDVNTYTENLVKTALESRKKGKNITQGTGKGIEDGLPGLGKTVGEMKDKVLDCITSVFGIHSPAKATQPHGKYIVQGVGKGMEDEIRGNTIKNVLNLLQTTIRNDVQGMFAKKEWVFSGVGKGLKETFSNVADKIKNPISKIVGYLNVMISGIETTINSCIKALNGLEIKFPSKTVKLAKKNGVDLSGSLGLNLNAINLQRIPIPHLAKGAVIPPRSEFVAVLGDQKHGTNIETPENLLRQVMREELGKINTSDGGTYEFTAQINRRTLFDEVIKEGKLRKKTTGRNAFQF